MPAVLKSNKAEGRPQTPGLRGIVTDEAHTVIKSPIILHCQQNSEKNGDDENRHLRFQIAHSVAPVRLVGEVTIIICVFFIIMPFSNPNGIRNNPFSQRDIAGKAEGCPLSFPQNHGEGVIFA